MRAVVQRVTSARVQVDGRAVGEIGKGLLILLGVAREDAVPDASWLAEKVATLRIFQDSEGRMNRSVKETGGSTLVVSQFTLMGDARKGRRPSFDKAAPPDQAERLYARFVELLRAELGPGPEVVTGSFGAYMQVSLVNDGPLTLILDSRKSF